MAHISSSEQIDDDCSDPIELERVRLRAIGRFYDTEGREEEGRGGEEGVRGGIVLRESGLSMRKGEPEWTFTTSLLLQKYISKRICNQLYIVINNNKCK